MSTDTLVLLFIFQNMSYYVQMTTLIKNVTNFQTGKLSLRVLLSICLIFCQFQAGVAYKSVAYKKSMYSKSTHWSVGRTKNISRSQYPWVFYSLNKTIVCSARFKSIMQHWAPILHNQLSLKLECSKKEKIYPEGEFTQQLSYTHLLFVVFRNTWRGCQPQNGY